MTREEAWRQMAVDERRALVLALLPDRMEEAEKAAKKELDQVPGLVYKFLLEAWDGERFVAPPPSPPPLPAKWETAPKWEPCA